MTEQTDKRAERLKAALRENLRRRKAQVRGRSEVSDGQPPQEKPSQEEPHGTRAGVREGDPAGPPEDDPA